MQLFQWVGALEGIISLPMAVATCRGAAIIWGGGGGTAPCGLQTQLSPNFLSNVLHDPYIATAMEEDGATVRM